MKKNIVSMLALTLIVTLFLGSTVDAGFFDFFNKDKKDEVIELSFWNGFTGPDGKGMAKMIDEFNRLNEGEVKVKMQVMDWLTYYQKVVTAISSGKAPDLGIMHIDRLPEFASKRVLTPLDTLIEDLNWSSKDFAKTVWDAGIYNGERYGIPLDIHPLAMYINIDMFKEAGLDPNNPPKTPEEFMEAVKALTKDTDGDGEIDQWGTAFPPLWPGPEFIVKSLIYQFGGSILNEDGTKVTYNSPEGIKALEYAIDLVHNKKLSPAQIQQDGEVTLFRQGKLGMHFNGIWMINGFKEQSSLNFMSYPIPAFGKNASAMAGSHNFVIFRQRKEDQAREKAAVKFIKYISENSSKWATYGQIPARNSVRDSEEFKSLKHQASIAKGLSDVVFPPLHPALNEVLTPLHQEVNLAILGEKTAKQALNDAAERAQKALDEYNRNH
ncbi:ABC transporter substrate-binding protein [Orenia metallireducens]|uniref:ABC transporter substrate-binding protein n=1 Tax=Orenia metallireducens TaxID=1413210 RepID=A0A1C0ADE8_9FIRM|nr:ABC transporter substrate-binding protein [Orenia metallireducens]OCL28751.1 ABC transporter substrate-binding protein [Orenia metallireducens]